MSYGDDLFASASYADQEAPKRNGDGRAVEAGGLAVVRVADVTPERVAWLWPGRIPLGKITILDGDPGLGKSAFTIDLAARVSTGSPLPDGAPLDGPADVVLLSAEDGIADTIRPRLEAAGADAARVHVVDHASDDHGPRPFELPTDVAALEQLVLRVDAALVVIDPLMAHLAGDVNSHRDQDVRRALYALADVAERTKAAVLIVRHLNKTAGGNPLYRGGGSIGIIGAARSGLVVAPNPDDDSRRVLAVSKANLARLAPSLVYRLAEDELYGAVRVIFEGASKHSARELLRVDADAEGEAPARVEAEQVLASTLANGRMLAKDVRQEARDAGISDRTLARAKRALGVEAERVGEPGRQGGGAWYWRLPASGSLNPELPLGTLNPGSVSAGQSDEAGASNGKASLRVPTSEDGSLNLIGPCQPSASPTACSSPRGRPPREP